ncbi:MAG: hypothetical protein WBF90_03320 [Rivularia sp. (in: cyanobacteria)]
MCNTTKQQLLSGFRPILSITCVAATSPDVKELLFRQYAMALFNFIAKFQFALPSPSG